MGKIFSNLKSMRISILAIFIVITKFVCAQHSDTIFIAAGQDVSAVLTPEKIYHYPQFINGKIFFRDGSTSDALLNYDYLRGEIIFISPKKDTLAISKDQMLNIKQVVIGRDIFFYNKRYVELVMENKTGKLLKNEMFDVVRREKIGGYNQPSSTSAIESYGSFTGTYGVPEVGLKIWENITLVLKTNYFFGDEFNLLLPANKKNIYKAYPAEKNRIHQYLEQNSVDYKNPADLKKLLAWLAQNPG